MEPFVKALHGSAAPRDNGTLQKVVNRTALKAAPRDCGYWLSRPTAERIAAVEALGQHWIAEPFDAEPGFQRVCRITLLKQS